MAEKKNNLPQNHAILLSHKMKIARLPSENFLIKKKFMYLSIIKSLLLFNFIITFHFYFDQLSEVLREHSTPAIIWRGMHFTYLLVAFYACWVCPPTANIFYINLLSIIVIIFKKEAYSTHRVVSYYQLCFIFLYI